MVRSTPPAAWLVRAGRQGERERTDFDEGVVIAGWNELGDMSDYQTREDLRNLLTETYPEGGRARIANWTGQLWRFLSVIQVGDHVVLPLESEPAVAVSRVTGPYE